MWSGYSTLLVINDTNPLGFGFSERQKSDWENKIENLALMAHFVFPVHKLI